MRPYARFGDRYDSQHGRNRAVDAAITNDIHHATLMTLGHAYGAVGGYGDERQVFLRFLYTSGTPKLRENPLGLAGWLSDMTKHARDVQVRVEDALRVLEPAET